MLFFFHLIFYFIMDIVFFLLYYFIMDIIFFIVILSFFCLNTTYIIFFLLKYNIYLVRKNKTYIIFFLPCEKI
jgi:hypothetical protein